jgi:integrase
VPEAVREQHEASHNGKVWNCEACRAFAPTGGPHSFRHTFASLFLAGRPDLFLLSKILGHSSERTTLIYAHMLPGAVASVAEVVSVGPATTASRKGTDVEE